MKRRKKKKFRLPSTAMDLWSHLYCYIPNSLMFNLAILVFLGVFLQFGPGFSGRNKKLAKNRLPSLSPFTWPGHYQQWLGLDKSPRSSRTLLLTRSCQSWGKSNGRRRPGHKTKVSVACWRRGGFSYTYLHFSFSADSISNKGPPWYSVEQISDRGNTKTTFFNQHPVPESQPGPTPGGLLRQAPFLVIITQTRHISPITKISRLSTSLPMMISTSHHSWKPSRKSKSTYSFQRSSASKHLRRTPGPMRSHLTALCLKPAFQKCLL